jgi:hypothetical protein
MERQKNNNINHVEGWERGANCGSYDEEQLEIVTTTLWMGNVGTKEKAVSFAT